MTTMDYTNTLSALRRLTVQTGSLDCLGCGHEHNCAIQGCAIIRNAVEHMEAADSLVAHLTSLNDDYLARIEELHKTLACREASQDEAYSRACKERDQAVADLGMLLDNCKVCCHQNAAPENCDCECMGCEKKCVCGDCIDSSRFEWRGVTGGA